MPELATAWITLAATTKGMERDISRALDRVENSSGKIKVKIDTDGVRRQGDEAGREFSSRFSAEVRGSSPDFAKSMGKAAGALFLGGFAASLAGGALAGVARSAVDEFRSIFETGLDFSRTLNNFQGVTRSTSAQMAQMQAAARALGSDTTLAGASASDAALAMTELAKAGFSVDQAITGARGTLELATAGQIDAAKAAEIQANAMNAFGLDATNAAHVADLLANAAVSSSADIPDLGVALQQVGGIAHGFGENLDDTIAALGIFANAGVKGSDAGTLLKTTMQSITDQGNPAQGAIHELGLELYKLNDAGQNQFVGFRELFRQLDEAKKRINDPEIFQAQTNILFGSDAMRSAMLGNADAFDQMLSDIEHVGGASELAASQMQGLPGAVEAFSNTVEGIRLDVFDKFGPAIAGPLTDFITYLSEHKGEVVQFFVTMGGAALTMAKVVASAIRDTAGVLGDLAGAVGMDDFAQSLHFVEDASGQAVIAIGKAENTLDAYGRQAAEAKKVTDTLGDSAKALTVVGAGVLIDVKDNTPETEAKLKSLGIHLQALANDPTRLELVADTAEAQRTLDVLRAQQSGEPLKVGVYADLGQANADMQKFFGTWRGAVLNVNPAVPPPPPPSSTSPLPGVPFAFPPPGHRATGGLFGAMPSSAVIQPATAGLIQWAEPSTRGEAFIPLGGGARSAQIWAQTGHLLGMFDQGGIRGSKGGLQPNASQLFDIIAQAFPQIQEIGGYRANGMGSNDHPSGEALDIMIPGWDTPGGKALGDQINQWLQANAQSLGLDDTIWQDYWQPTNGGAGHLLGRMGQGPDQAHLTHIHAKVKGGAATGATFSGLAGAGGQYVDQQDVFDAESRAIKARNDLEVQRKQLAELEAKGTATESQLLAARNDIAEQERDVQSADAKVAEARRGKLKKTKQGGGSGSSGPGGEELGQAIFSGFLQSFGLDGSVFSDFTQWPNFKSGIALANFGGSLLKTALGGGEDTSGTGGGGGFSVGGLNLPGLADLKPVGPSALSPIDPNSTAHGAGLGAPPGPLVAYNGPVQMGVDPRAMTQRQNADMNQAYRGSGLPAVKPG